MPMLNPWLLEIENDKPCQAQRAFAFNQPGDYRIYTSNLKGVTTLCGNTYTNADWKDNELTTLTVDTGDFYYDSRITGGFRAFAYNVSSAPQPDQASALNQIPTTTTVYAKEPLLRYVTQFYSSIEMRDNQKLSLNGAGWYAYSSVQSAFGANAGQGAEGAYPHVNGTEEQDRIWVAQFDANGEKIAGTSQPKWG
jgi:hypothetical protein